MAKQLINTLSIIIPTINEAGHLPLLLADLKTCPYNLDLNIIDAGSTDLTILIAKLAGGNVIKSGELNRGYQMKLGAQSSKGEWMLFLHADCRLDHLWSQRVNQIINKSSSKSYCWFFDFKLNRKSLELILLEKAVAFRSNFLQKPYGDQGLLIHRSLYEKTGGFSSLCIMEDIDFILRLKKITKIKSLGIPLFTNARKWKRVNILKRAIINAKLRRRWKKGEDLKQIYYEYYSK